MSNQQPRDGSTQTTALKLLPPTLGDTQSEMTRHPARFKSHYRESGKLRARLQVAEICTLKADNAGLSPSYQSDVVGIRLIRIKTDEICQRRE
jgi:hypothetical protein